MRTEYQRDIHNNYMVIEPGYPIDESSYQVRMLLANVIPFFLPCRLQNMDGKKLFYYEVTSRQSLSGIYEGKKLNYEELKQIFSSFLEVVEKMAEYLLNPDHLVLTPEQIYLDVERRCLYFCYLPGYERPVREQFQSLTEYILPKLDHEDERAVILGYGIYRRALEDVFVLDHMKEEIYRCPAEKSASSIAGSAVSDVSVSNNSVSNNSVSNNSIANNSIANNFKPNNFKSNTNGFPKLSDENNRQSVLFHDTESKKNRYEGKRNIGEELEKRRTRDRKIQEKEAQKSRKQKKRKQKKQIEKNQTEENPIREKQMQKEGTDTGKGKESVLDTVIFCISCGLAAVVILLVILAGYYGYIPIPDTEILLAGIAGILLFMGFLGFIVKKINAKYGSTRSREAEAEEQRGIVYQTFHQDAFDTDSGAELISDQRPVSQPISVGGPSGRPTVDRTLSDRKGKGQKLPERQVLHRTEEEEDYGETTILSHEPVRGPASFVSREPGELATIYLQKDLMILGKMETASDAVIPLPTVSRLHAKVRRIGQEYFLTDLNSRNGTAVNGRMLKAEESYHLQDEDEVDFGQARYIFLK